MTLIMHGKTNALADPLARDVLSLLLHRRAAFRLEIADSLSVCPADVARVLDLLVENGWAEQHESEFGVPGHIFSPTVKGREALTTSQLQM